jgi:enterochelin esterase family protein
MTVKSLVSGTRLQIIFLLSFLLLLLALPLWGQMPRGVRSPEVHADKRVTFRLRAPNAKQVILAREGAGNLPMQRNEQGVWVVTTDALEADLYGYSFVVDGVATIDPSNPLMKPNLINTQSMVHVPGDASVVWERNAVPQGALHRHFYKSEVVGDQRDFYVYTPSGYDPKANRRYPVLYLLHGYSDDAGGWTAVGRAHIILDNLIAQGKAKPMLVVMPLGYGAPEIVNPAGNPIRDPNVSRTNFDKFRDALLTEVIPQVEKGYRVRTDRESRAITGLSMGGGESLFVGLNAVDRFAWVGSFSGALIMVGNDYAKLLPQVDEKLNARLRLLWIGCGTEDFLLDANRKLEAWLTSKNVSFSKVETKGAHTWLVWRRYLADFVPLLFVEKSKASSNP